jgi:hypothetical protein
MLAVMGSLTHYVQGLYLYLDKVAEILS